MSQLLLPCATNWRHCFSLGLKCGRRCADSLCVAPDLYCGLVDLPIKVLTARDYGLDDIRSTEELMRSLLRDVQMAYNAAVASEGIDVHSSVAEALEHFVATSALSNFHSQSARAVVSVANLPTDFVAWVNVGLKDGWRNGGRHGSRE